VNDEDNGVRHSDTLYFSHPQSPDTQRQLKNLISLILFSTIRWLSGSLQPSLKAGRFF